jgi:hypothetical protein
MPHDSPMGNTLRGALIAYGVAFFSWWFARTLPADPANAGSPGDLYLIALGLVLQLTGWTVKWLVGRYEREHGMTGMLTPTVVGMVQLLIDGVTVSLFAIATFRSIAILPSAI